MDKNGGCVIYNWFSLKHRGSPRRIDFPGFRFLILNRLSLINDQKLGFIEEPRLGTFYIIGFSAIELKTNEFKPPIVMPMILYLINILSGLFISLFILISWLGGSLVREPFISMLRYLMLPGLVLVLNRGCQGANKTE